MQAADTGFTLQRYQIGTAGNQLLGNMYLRPCEVVDNLLFRLHLPSHGVGLGFSRLTMPQQPTDTLSVEMQHCPSIAGLAFVCGSVAAG